MHHRGGGFKVAAQRDGGRNSVRVLLQSLYETGHCWCASRDDDGSLEADIDVLGVAGVDLQHGHGVRARAVDDPFET